jgi:hypothetical protein
MYKLDTNKNSKTSNFDGSIKSQLIDYIYSTVDISKFRYEMLEFTDDLPKLFNDKYNLTANFVGTNCLLVFTKIKGKFYAFTIDRKTLSYSKNKIDLDKVDLKYVSIETDSTIYNGTILDGILIKKGRNYKDQFIISDIYTFKGVDYSNISLDVKLFEIKSYLETTTPQINLLKNRHKHFSGLDLGINKLYSMNDVDKFVNKVVPQLKDYKVRGINFYPEYSGTKLIYLFSNNKKTDQYNNSNNNSNNNNNEKKLTKYKFISSTVDPVYSVLEMKTTNTVDIYRLYSVEKIKKNNKTMLKRKKMGIAYIPTTERSKWCQKILLESNKTSLLVKCLFHDNKGKWEPIELDTKSKFPTLFSDINIEVVEMSDSDDE